MCLFLEGLENWELRIEITLFPHLKAILQFLRVNYASVMDCVSGTKLLICSRGTALSSFILGMVCYPFMSCVNTQFFINETNDRFFEHNHKYSYLHITYQKIQIINTLDDPWFLHQLFSLSNFSTTKFLH